MSSWELDEYKKQVKEVAKRVAAEQGWCQEGLREVLKELDIELTDRVQFEVVVRFVVTATNVSEGNDPLDTDFIEGSLRELEVDMDSDWRDVTSEIESLEITDVEAVDED